MSLTLILLVLGVRSSHPAAVKRFATEEMYNSDPSIKAAIDGNNGVPVAPGHHAHLVVFMKKPDFAGPGRFKQLPTTPPDFSVDGPFICSGTILNRRHALTRATPIAYYPIGSYWMVSQHEILPEIDPGMMNLIDIDFVAIHPEHEPGAAATDVAVLRTSKDMKFGYETRNVNFAVSTSFDNCKLVVWSWFFDQNAERKFDAMTKGEISVQVTRACTDGFFCLAQSHQPCAVNSGSPLLCNCVLVGLYAGPEGGAACNASTSHDHRALRLDGATGDWLTRVLSPPLVDSLQLDYFENKRKVDLVTCPAPQH